MDAAGEAPDRFRGFAEMEGEAVSLSSYETLVVDGLFQTEASMHGR